MSKVIMRKELGPSGVQAMPLPVTSITIILHKKLTHVTAFSLSCLVSSCQSILGDFC